MAGPEEKILLLTRPPAIVQHEAHCAESFREQASGMARGVMKKTQRRDVPHSESRREAMVRLTQVSALALAGALAEPAKAETEKPNLQAAPAAGNASFYHPIATGTSPNAFNAKQFAILSVLVDMMIPRTDTPGAADAGVHWYVDRIAGDKLEVREKLSQGLTWLDDESHRRFGKDFVEADAADRARLLTMISDLPEANSADARLASGRDFFRQVKAMTIQGYYQSEIGMMEELHWAGNQILAEMPGCPERIPGFGGQR
jgi:gluconate 2-dehydrogenase subunit 3-like protein